MTKNVYCKFSTHYLTFLEFMKLYYREVFSIFLHISNWEIWYNTLKRNGSFSVMRQNPLKYGTTVYGVSYFDIKVNNMDNQTL